LDDRFWNRLIFKNISKDSREAILKINSRECVYAANELIIEEGEEIKDICVILEGVLKSTEYTSDGKELNSSYFYVGKKINSSYPFAGDAFPFYLIYGGIKRYFFNTYSVKKSRVIWLPVKELLPIIERDSIFLKNVLQFVAEYACYSKIILRGVQYRKIEDRLAYWMLNLNDPDKDIPIPYSQEVLADILHVSRSSLNQELKRLKNEKIISYNGKSIKILNKNYFKERL